MKRSRQAGLVLMGAAPLFLAACGESTSEAAYTTVEHCVKDGGTQQACMAAYDSAQAEHAKSAPRYTTREECIAAHGVDQCEQRSDGQGGSFFTPFLAGFFVSNLMNRSSSSYYSSPLYRGRSGGYVYAPSALSEPGRAPTMREVSSPPNRAVTRSRSGFGSSSAARGSWGG